MRTRFGDFDRTLDVLDELRRNMDRVWDDLDDARSGWPPRSPASPWPRLNVYDAGSSVVVEADLPGVSEKDIDLTLADGVLSLSGERKVHVPDGFQVRRQERAAFRFARSVALPCKVDPERTTAATKDGVLTVTLPKAEEARPRQIQVRAQRG